MRKRIIAVATCLAAAFGLAFAPLASAATAAPVRPATQAIGSWWGQLFTGSDGTKAQAHYVNTTNNLTKLDGYNVFAKPGRVIASVEVWETQFTFESTHIVTSYPRTHNNENDFGFTDLPWLRNTSGPIVAHIRFVDANSYVASYSMQIGAP